MGDGSFKATPEVRWVRGSRRDGDDEMGIGVDVDRQIGGRLGGASWGWEHITRRVLRIDVFSGGVFGAVVGEVPKRSNGADCKSAG